METRGSVAVVTGAASPRGIGWATALRLADDGAAVAVLDRDGDGVSDLVEQISSRGGRAHGITLDVSRSEEVARAFDEVVAELGAPDVLVNNAGVTQRISLLDMSEEDWDRVLAVNLKSAFLCTQAAARSMTRRGQGRVVCVSSIAARNGQGFGAAHYAASKAGMIGLVRALANELGPQGITVNAIAPGAIETDIIRRNVPPEQLEQYRASRISQTPLRRFGTPDDVAEAVSYLAFRADFTTGAVLDLNGGRFTGG